jgi:hypothetical protein
LSQLGHEHGIVEQATQELFVAQRSCYPSLTSDLQDRVK